MLHLIQISYNSDALLILRTLLEISVVMLSYTATLSLDATQSVQAANHFATYLGTLLDGTMTLNAGTVDARLEAPPGLRYPDYSSSSIPTRRIHAQMTAAAAPAFEFWLNEDDAIYRGW